MSPGKSAKRPINTAIIVLMIAGGWGTAILTNWEEIFNRDEVPIHEEMSCLRQISEVMYENKAANKLYADFREEADKHTLFSDYSRIWKHFGDTKQELLNRMKDIQPTPKYSRLCEILSVSLQSDVKLMSLEQKSLQHTLDGLKQMESTFLDNKQMEDPSLSEEEKRRQAWELLNQFRIKNKEWLNKAQEIGASLESTRATSIAAVQLLNEELGRLSLPYKHDNPYTEKKRSTDASIEQ